MDKCPRCGGGMQSYSMSFFSEEEICSTCKFDEMGAPNYVEAKRAESNAVRMGDFNFPGIGLKEEDLAYLAEKRKERHVET